MLITYHLMIVREVDQPDDDRDLLSNQKAKAPIWQNCSFKPSAKREPGEHVAYVCVDCV